jgi:hypothetical protein
MSTVVSTFKLYKRFWGCYDLGVGNHPAHHTGAIMKTRALNEFTARTLMALATARADRDVIDADIRVMEACLAKEHGLLSPYPPVA